MADNILTLTANAGAITAGQAVQPGNWSNSFDHAALIASLRSRADGFDFRLRHVATGVQVAFNQSGVGGSTCKLAFIIAADIANAASDFYTLTAGDLRVRASPFSGVFPGGVGTCSVAVAALSVPVCSHPLERFDVFDVSRMDALTHRTAKRSENPRAKYRLNYANISAEDWYELRAVIYSVRGGAGVLPVPSFIASAASGMIATDATFTKHTNGSFQATLVLEEVIA